MTPSDMKDLEEVSFVIAHRFSWLTQNRFAETNQVNRRDRQGATWHSEADSGFQGFWIAPHRWSSECIDAITDAIRRHSLSLRKVRDPRVPV